MAAGGKETLSRSQNEVLSLAFGFGGFFSDDVRVHPAFLTPFCLPSGPNGLNEEAVFTARVDLTRSRGLALRGWAGIAVDLWSSSPAVAAAKERRREMTAIRMPTSPTRLPVTARARTVNPPFWTSARLIWSREQRMAPFDRLLT